MSWDKMFVRGAWCVVSGVGCAEVGLCEEAHVTLSHPPARTTSVPIDKIKGMLVLSNVPWLIPCMCRCVHEMKLNISLTKGVC